MVLSACDISRHAYLNKKENHIRDGAGDDQQLDLWPNEDEPRLEEME